MRRRPRLVLSTLLVVALASAGASADDGEAHLLEGATLYRAGRFDEALVEFQVALKLGGSREALWYAAASLAKLGRKQQALEGFLIAEAQAPDFADAVLKYHAALACYALGLLTCADARLQMVQQEAGPRIAAQAASVRAAIAQALATPPPQSAVDALLEGAARFTREGRPRLAAAYRAEAEALARIRREGRRVAQTELPAAAPADAGTP